MPVKIGIPAGFGGSALAPEVESPVYATGVGLVMRALNQTSEIDIRAEEGEEMEEEITEKGSMFKRMKKFFEEL